MRSQVMQAWIEHTDGCLKCQAAETQDGLCAIGKEMSPAVEAEVRHSMAQELAQHELSDEVKDLIRKVQKYELYGGIYSALKDARFENEVTKDIRAAIPLTEDEVWRRYGLAFDQLIEAYLASPKEIQEKIMLEIQPGMTRFRLKASGASSFRKEE